MKTNILNEWKLENDLKVRHVEKFPDYFNSMVKEQFDDRYPILRWRHFLSEQERKVVKNLNNNLSEREQINIGIFKGDKVIAWSYGWQGGMEPATFYMANSCVLSQYRRKGLYTLMMKKVMEIAQNIGFHTLTSRHLVSNNSVLIAKLKAGFKISGMEMSEIHGNLVHLTYFYNELRSESFNVRSGLMRPNSSIIKDLYLETNA